MVLAWTITLVTLGIFVAVMIPEQKRDLRAELESKANGVAVALHGEVAEAAISEDYSSVVEHAMQVLKGDSGVEFSGDHQERWALRGGRSQRLAHGAECRRILAPSVRRPGVNSGSCQCSSRESSTTPSLSITAASNGDGFMSGCRWMSYDESSRQVNLRTGLLAVVCVLVGLLASVLYAGRFVRPILQLQSVVERVARGDLQARADIRSRDEIERLAQSFNGMADMILHRDQELSEAKRDLERRVVERTQELREQINAKDAALADLAEAQKRLIELSRISGMAEVATGVLHNVGNVLNSVNVSAAIVADHLRESRVSQMSELVRMLEEHKCGLEDFLSKDVKGRRVLPYMTNLSQHLEQERDQLGKEVASLAQHVSHIKEIVAMQQTYARSSGVLERIALSDLMEDVLGITRPGMERHRISLEIKSDYLPPIMTDRHKVLQILLNLMRNAKDAIKSSAKLDRKITVRMMRVNEERVAIRLADNGIGIPAENLVRIFSHGFTTKKDGHGFGLHSGALAAKQLGGSLTVESPGSNEGAAFTLELPIDAGNIAREGATA